MASIDKRIRKIEENSVLQPMERGSTKLDVHNIPEAEYTLLMKALKIGQSVEYEDLTPSQKLIVECAHKRFGERVLDLFLMFMDSAFCLDNHMAIRTFHLRFVWFLRELKKDSIMWITADQIEAEHIDDGDEVDHVDKYFRTQPSHYSEESWDKFENEYMQEMVKEMKESGEWDKLGKQ